MQSLICCHPLLCTGRFRCNLRKNVKFSRRGNFTPRCCSLSHRT